MDKKRNIESYFDGVIENINIILSNDFYTDKNNLKKVRKIVGNWYKNYKENNTLKGINPKELEYIGLEITDFFDRYLIKESSKDNYSERLSYDFGHLELSWKEEMLGGKNSDW